MEGLIFGRAYLRREICVSKSTGLALQLEVNLSCFTLYLREIFQVQAPGGRFNGGFFALRFGGLIFGGAYTWKGLIFGILRYSKG